MDFDNETRENQTTTETVKPDLDTWTVFDKNSAWISADLGSSVKTIRELTSIRVTFSETMTVSTVTTNTDNTSCYGIIQVYIDGASTVCTRMYDNMSTSDNITFTVTPRAALTLDTVYKIKVAAGSKDVSGNSKSEDNVTSNGFKTCKYAVAFGCE